MAVPCGGIEFLNLPRTKTIQGRMMSHVCSRYRVQTSRVLAESVISNAMILNACLSTLYVLIGSFRGLLKFQG